MYWSVISFIEVNRSFLYADDLDEMVIYHAMWPRIEWNARRRRQSFEILKCLGFPPPPSLQFITKMRLEKSEPMIHIIPSTTKKTKGEEVINDS